MTPRCNTIIDVRHRLPPYKVEAQLTALSETMDWNLAACNVPQHWRATQGQDIKVAILDTGAELEHPDLAGAIDDAHDFTRSRFGPADRLGHGTHIAGTVAARNDSCGVVGLAPQCRLLIGKVIGDDGSGASSAIAAGIDWACDGGADVISLSLGAPDASDDIHDAILRAAAKGKFVICSANNGGRDNSVYYPARWLETVAVGAIDRQGVAMRHSSRGPEIDICAPAQDIVSTFPSGGYARLSGPSLAAAFVTGVVALVLAKHRLQGGQTPLRDQQHLLHHLRRTATAAPSFDHDSSYGLIHPDSVLLTHSQVPPPRAPTITSDNLTVVRCEEAFVFETQSVH